MNIVLFLGAGFSAPFGMPTMNDFIDQARISRRLGEEEKELLTTLFTANREVSFLLDSPPTNLENILSYALMSERLGLLPTSQERLSTKIVDIIRKIYCEIGDLDRYFQVVGQVDRFLNYEMKNKDNSIEFITTNYDLNLEFALYNMGKAVDPNIEYTRHSSSIQNSGSLYHTHNSFPVYKLHGSVNWFIDSNSHNFSIDDNVNVCYAGNISDSNKEERGNSFFIPDVFRSDYQNSNEPIIIPPSFIKPKFQKQLEIIWSKAASAISNADRLIFIGYSFPATDTEMKYFLTCSLAKILILDEFILLIQEQNNSLKN